MLRGIPVSVNKLQIMRECSKYSSCLARPSIPISDAAIGSRSQEQAASPGTDNQGRTLVRTRCHVDFRRKKCR